jgi:glycosyltransferase involved in cell wall biosynthesis
VVDEDEAAKLAEGIRRVLADEALRRRLGENAWERARADFDVREAREAFARLVGLEGGQGA